MRRGRRPGRTVRVGSIASEAWRNLATGTSRAVLWALLVVTLGCALALADAAAVLDVERRSEQLYGSGAATHLLVAANQVSGAACDALAEIETVSAAGALRTTASGVVLASAPSTPVPLSEVTPGLVDLLDIEETGAQTGVVLSGAVAEQVLAEGAEDLRLLDGRQVPVLGTYSWPADGRLQALSFASLSPTTSTGAFDECWVTVWPTSAPTVDLLPLALLPGATASDVSTTQLNSSLGSDFDGEALVRDRATAGVAGAGACLGLLVGLVGVRLRRLELASARQAGVSRPALVGQVVLETLVWSGAAVVASLALLVLLLYGRSSDPVFLLQVAARPVLSAALAGIVAAAVATSAVRQRSIWRYFKER